MASTIRTMLLECGGLVVPVALRGASERRDVSFDSALRFENDGEVEYRRIRQIRVPDPDLDAETLVIDPLRRKKTGEIEGIQYEGEPVKGVWDGHEFIEIEPSEIAEIDRLTTLPDLTIQEFVPLAEVPWERSVASYFLIPASNMGTAALRSLATLREAMEHKAVAGVAKLMPKSRQKLVVIYPAHGGLMVTCLAYADTFQQVIDGAASIEGVAVNEEARELMETLIELKSAPVETLSVYRDDLIELRADLIERVALGGKVKTEETEEKPVAAPLTQDALMVALQASVAAAQAKKAEAALAAKAPKRKSPAKGKTPAKGRTPAKV